MTYRSLFIEEHETIGRNTQVFEHFVQGLNARRQNVAFAFKFFSMEVLAIFCFQPDFVGGIPVLRCPILFVSITETQKESGSVSERSRFW